jgi:hypothetical protein
MATLRNQIVLMLFIILAAMHIACSGSDNPVSNSSTASNVPEITSVSAQESGRDILGIWNVSIDTVAQTVSVEPIDRVSTFHFPLTQLYPNVLAITDYGFSPHFWADIQLSHPFQGSGIDAFDPRVIAVLPANTGVSFNYSTINANANNRVIMYPDGYTNLFDRTDFTGNLNPFMAYFLTIPYRRWSSTGNTTETMRWDMDINGFGGPLKFALVVDVSTNYPAAPTPVIDNASEPVSLNAVITPGLNPDGGSATVEVTLLDWQGLSGIGGVVVESPYLFSGIRWLSYIAPGPNPNEYVFSGEITNEFHSPIGDYKVAVVTWDTLNNIFNLKEFTAHVGEASLNPVDVTPPWLNITPEKVVYSRNYAFVAAGYNGLHIFHIFDLTDIQWVASVPSEEMGFISDVDIEGSYAYIVDRNIGLKIINISEPSDPRVVKTINTSDQPNAIDVQGDYAFIACNNYFSIVDINPPQNAYVVNEFPQGFNDAKWVKVNRDYAYVATWDDSLYCTLIIYDIDPIGSAYELNSVSFTSSTIYDIDILNGYAYIAGDASISVFDVSPPGSAFYSHYIPVGGQIQSLQILGNYGYSASGKTIKVIDLSTPGSETIINTISLPGYATDVYPTSSTGIAVLTDSLATMDTSIPGSESIWTFWHFISTTWSFCVENSYLYHCGYNDGVTVWEVGYPEVPEYRMLLESGHISGESDADNGYLYTTGQDGFSIFDIDPIENAYLVNQISPPNSYREVVVANGYAYIADESFGLRIVDVDPPGSAYIVKTVDTPYLAYGVDYFNGYVYVADLMGGLHIVDVDPPSSANIVKTVPTVGAEEAKYLNGYVYVADYTGGLAIIDVEPPASASIVKTVPIADEAWGVSVTSDYAFIAAIPGSLQIVDINPISTASVVSVVPIPYRGFSVGISNNYAFISADAFGVRIIRLW